MVLVAFFARRGRRFALAGVDQSHSFYLADGHRVGVDCWRDRPDRRFGLLPRKPATTTELLAVSWQQALAIGLAQVVALVPGVLPLPGALDNRRPAGWAGSALGDGLLVLPGDPATLGAATLYDLARSLPTPKQSDFGYLLVGTVVAGVVAGLSIGWLLRFVAHHTFVVFGVYRVIAGRPAGAARHQRVVARSSARRASASRAEELFF